MTTVPLLTVVYTGEPDQVFEFHSEQQEMLFGRDDQLCQIVIWSAINGSELSGVAGKIWRRDDELWVRNLSTSHDLFIDMPGRPSDSPLPPRRDASERGWARSIPGELAYLRAPGGCELQVRQQTVGDADAMVDAPLGSTIRIPEIPLSLRPVAAALCEPLLEGGQLPAAYSQIASRIGEPSIKKVRNLVAQLCQLYESTIPTLASRIAERRLRDEAALDLPTGPVMQNGVWRFNGSSDPEQIALDRQRRRALALPDYYEVAHLLVRYGRVQPGYLPGPVRPGVGVNR